MWRNKAVWIACLAILLIAGSVAAAMATGGNDSTDDQAVAAAQSEVSALAEEMTAAGLSVTDSGYVAEAGQDPAYYRIQIQTGEWDKYLWDYDLATRILAKAKAEGYIAVNYADIILVDAGGNAIPHLAEIQRLDTELWPAQSESGCAAIEGSLVAQVKKTAKAQGFGVLHFSVMLTNGTPAAVIDLAMPEAFATGDLEPAIGSVWAELSAVNVESPGALGLGRMRVFDSSGKQVIAEYRDFMLGTTGLKTDIPGYPQ